jgi:chromate transporter
MLDDNVYLQLALVFGKLGLLSLGGNGAVVAEVSREMAVHGWMSQEQFVRNYALSQLAPGPGGFAPITLGYHVAGYAGAIVAWTAYVLPTVVLALLAVAVWHRVRHLAWPTAMRAALTPIVLGLSAASLVALGRPMATDWRADALAVATLLLVQRTSVPVAVVPLASAALGAWLFGTH